MGLNKTLLASIISGMGGSQNAMPYLPLVDIAGSEGTSGEYIKNRSVVQDVDGNLYAYSTGLIVATGFNVSNSVVTRNYANGPAGNLTAMRCQITPTASQAYVSLLNSVTMPAGTYTFGVKIKSTTSAGNQSVRVGINGSLVLTAVTEGAWTPYTQTFTFASPSTMFLLLQLNVAETPADVIVDEIQIYKGSTLPAYGDEVLGNHLVPLVRKGTNIVVTGGLLDNTGNKAPGEIKLTTFPAKMSFTEGSIVASVDTAETTGNYGKIICLTGVTGTWDIGLHLGKAYAQPVLNPSSGASVFSSGLHIAGKGTNILGCTFNATKKAFYLNGVLMLEVIASTGPFSNRAFGVCGDPMNDTPTVSSHGQYPFLGKIGGAAVFDKYLTDAQIGTVTKILNTRHTQQSGAGMTPKNFWLAEGDSITQGYGTGLNTYFKRFFDTLPAAWFGFNSATAGARLLTGGANEDLMERQPLTLRRVSTGVAAGHNVVVSVLIGANLIPTIADLTAYYDSLRAAGAKVIACTITPNNSASYPNFEADRIALNTLIRSNSTHYDALCDFGADASIGVRTVTTVNAAPVPAYYQDYVHLNDAGYAIAYGLMNAALASLALY